MKNISILGSTGSIGVQTLDVVRSNSQYKVISLSGNENIELLEKQALEFRPKLVSVGNKDKAKILKDKLKPYDINVECGLEGIVKSATMEESDYVLNSVVGMVGLLPTLEAIRLGKTVALANKETLVAGGELVMKELKLNDVTMIPVDSEHSAIFQCLKSGNKGEVNKIILTASGGPFRGKSKKDLEKVSVRDALKHPNWSMGKKISIDSATLMNKGLEVIEAKWLFDIELDKIDVLVHPQSIIHSMVEFIDGSVIAQLGTPDMRIPIQYALTYPNRIENEIEKLSLIKNSTLTFEEPDYETFSCLSLAIDSIKQGGTLPTVLNASNEVAVDLFLKEKIRFLDIPRLIENVMSKHKNVLNPNIDDILSSDKWSREKTMECLERGGYK